MRGCPWHGYSARCGIHTAGTYHRLKAAAVPSSCVGVVPGPDRLVAVTAGLWMSVLGKEQCFSKYYSLCAAASVRQGYQGPWSLPLGLTA